MQVLNDNWVSVTSGSEDFSFKAMRKNQYEESLFRCEDDRFEMDMIIETNSSVIEALQPVQARLASLSAEERSAFKLPEGALTAVHLRCVERIYGNDHGSDLRDLLARSPACVVPVVLKRLQQKDKEWRKARRALRSRAGPLAEGQGVLMPRAVPGEGGHAEGVGRCVREEYLQEPRPPQFLLQAGSCLCPCACARSPARPLGLPARWAAALTE